MHNFYYARLANKAYEYDAAKMQDNEMALTVCAYDEDEEIAARQRRLHRGRLQPILEEELGPLFDWSVFEHGVRNVLSKLLRGAAPSIGEWSRSRAYYSFDIIIDASEVADVECEDYSCDVPLAVGLIDGQVMRLVPKLLEVNFIGDWHGVEHAMDTPDAYHQWIKDLLTYLTTDVDPSELNVTEI